MKKYKVGRFLLACGAVAASAVNALAVDTTVADLAAAADISTLQATQKTFLLAGVGITLGFVAFSLIRKSMRRGISG